MRTRVLRGTPAQLTLLGLAWLDAVLAGH